MNRPQPILDYLRRLFQLMGIASRQLTKAARRRLSGQPVEGHLLLREGMEQAGGLCDNHTAPLVINRTNRVLPSVSFTVFSPAVPRTVYFRDIAAGASDAVVTRASRQTLDLMSLEPIPKNFAV